MSKPKQIDNKYDRIIVLVDMDCFYCQVEERLNPNLAGKPIAVVQYNEWKGGGIIAVNYPARDKGVTRRMRGDEAKQHCPDIELIRVPNVGSKADLSKYREAGKEVADVLQTFTSLVERASVDEAYLDITEAVLARIEQIDSFVVTTENLENTYAVGFEKIGSFVKAISSWMGNNMNKFPKNSFSNQNTEDSAIDDDEISDAICNKNDIMLLIGASIVNDIRLAVKKRTGYECSAGIAHNKILAKLVCGINKPNKQTILPIRFIGELYSNLPIKRIRGLGGKFGDEVCEILNATNMSELKQFSKRELQQHFDTKNGLWLYLLARGIDLEPVVSKLTSNSIGCCKKFPGRSSIKGIATLKHWCVELAKEICERLEKDEIENNRRARQITVSFSQEIDSDDISSSRSITIKHIEGVDELATITLDVIKSNTKQFFKSDTNTILNNAIKFLGISVGKFEDLENFKNNQIQNMFNDYAKKSKSSTYSLNVNENVSNTTNPLVQTNSEPSKSTSNKSNQIQNMFNATKAKSSTSSLNLSENVSNTINTLVSSKMIGTVDSSQSATHKSNQIQNMFNDYAKKSKSLTSSPKLNENVSNTINPLMLSELETKGESSKSTSNKSNQIQDMFNTTKSKSSTSSPKSNENLSNTINTLLPSDITTVDSSQSTSNKSAQIQNMSQKFTNEELSTDTLLLSIKRTTDESSQPTTISIISTPEVPKITNEFLWPDPIFETCGQCNKKVLLTEYQTHADMHLAFQLSQEQRMEYRNQFKSKTKLSLNSSQSAKKAKLDLDKNKKNSLDRFFRKASPDCTEVNSNVIDNLNEKCTECNKFIAKDLMAEHKDYHVAKKLQQEISFSPNNNNKNVKDKIKCNKDLASYFK